jgi:hypothetical protein
VFRFCCECCCTLLDGATAAGTLPCCMHALASLYRTYLCSVAAALGLQETQQRRRQVDSHLDESYVASLDNSITQ